MNGYVQGYVLHECLKKGSEHPIEAYLKKELIKLNLLNRQDVVIQSAFGDYKMGTDITKKGSFKGVLIRPHINGTFQVKEDVTFYPTIPGARCCYRSEVFVGMHPDEAI